MCSVDLLQARRVNIGGKLLTNYLKEIISYRQWNVMDEYMLINDVSLNLLFLLCIIDCNSGLWYILVDYLCPRTSCSILSDTHITAMMILIIECRSRRRYVMCRMTLRETSASAIN